MNFVVDASFALAWVLEDEATPATEGVLELLGQGAIAMVPPLWRWEIGNVLLNVERRQRATKGEVRGHFLRFQALPIAADEMAFEQAWDAVYLLAQKHKLTSYDAAYLEMAIRHGLPLATLDADLLKAAQSEKIHLLPAR